MTNQSRPLFSEGEAVTTASENPEDRDLVGLDLVVVSVFDYQQATILLGETPGYPDIFYYAVEPIIAENIPMVGQRFLRKRYPPSEKSFSELMDTLKSPEKVFK